MTALHGFLGRPEDWDGVLGEEWSRPGWLRAGFLLSQVADPESFTTADTESSEEPLVEQGKARFIEVGDPSPPEGRGESAYLLRLAHQLNVSAEGDTLLGYSMGGRIALHMLLAEPDRWKRAIIVSASPGLLDETPGHEGGTRDTERLLRLRGDEAWAGRFLHDEWDAVVRDWNAQPVFAHDPPELFPRREADFDRHALAAALALGSVARQADLRPRLRESRVPILWIAGARDAKYAALAAQCAALNPLFSMTTLRTGHRVPRGDPDGFRRAVAEFTTIRA